MENKPDNGEENKLRTFQRLADVSLRTSATTLTIIFAYTLLFIYVAERMDTRKWFKDLIFLVTVSFSIANITGNYLALNYFGTSGLIGWGLPYFFIVTFGLSLLMTLARVKFSRLKASCLKNDCL